MVVSVPYIPGRGLLQNKQKQNNKKKQVASSIQYVSRLLLSRECNAANIHV